MSFNKSFIDDLKKSEENLDHNSTQSNQDDQDRSYATEILRNDTQDNTGFLISSYYNTDKASDMYQKLIDRKSIEEENKFKEQRYQNGNKLAKFAKVTMQMERNITNEMANFQILERKAQSDEEFRRSVRHQRQRKELIEYNQDMAENLMIEKGVQDEELLHYKAKIDADRRQRKLDQEYLDAKRAQDINNSSMMVSNFSSLNISAQLNEDKRQEKLRIDEADHEKRLVDKRNTEIDIATHKNKLYLNNRRAQIEIDENERFKEDSAARARRQNFFMDRQNAMEKMLDVRKLHQEQEEAHQMAMTNIEKDKILFEQKEKRRNLDRLSDLAEKISGGDDMNFADMQMLTGTGQGNNSVQFNRGKVLICLILDESGSMNKSLVLKGLNNFLSDQKRNCPSTTEMMIMKFNTNVNVMLNIQQIKTIPQFTHNDYNPGGCTALYDAIIDGIGIAERNLTDNDSLICVIMTDGHDNRSRRTKADVANLIKSKSKNRLYVYIGDQPDVWVRDVGVQPKYAVKFDDQNPLNNFKFMTNLVNQLLKQILQFGFKLLMDI